MTHKENITAILECYFTGFKKEIIDSACNRILEQAETVTEFADRCRECGKMRTGHWIIMGDRYIKCSECGHITKTESPDICHFCKVCGVRMSEEPTDSEPQESEMPNADIN